MLPGLKDPGSRRTWRKRHAGHTPLRPPAVRTCVCMCVCVYVCVYVTRRWTTPAHVVAGRVKELRLTSNHRRRAAQQREQGDVGWGDQKTKKQGCLHGTPCTCAPTPVSGGAHSTSSPPQMQGLVNCHVQAPAVTTAAHADGAGAVCCV